MKKMEMLMKRRSVLIGAPLIIAALALAVISTGDAQKADHAGHEAAMGQAAHSDTTYTCPMHPDYVSDSPGKCPTCGMYLVPRVEDHPDGEEGMSDSSSMHESGKEMPRQHGELGEALYHCPMHPTYVSKSPGECPICGMTLVPIEPDEGGESKVEGRSGVSVDPDKQQLIGVTFDTARVSDLTMKIRTVGHLTYDETKIVKIHTRISGWVEKLFVDYTGQQVKRGQPLFSIYSPQLYSTQEEYLLAKEGEDIISKDGSEEALANARSLTDATKRRLKLWDITDGQIDNLEKTGKSEVSLEIVSPIDGFVTEKSAFEGRYVNPGDILYTISDLRRIWAIADVYEYELPYIELGQEAKISLSYFPGEEFTGRVDYVYPYLNNKTRTVGVRFIIENDELKLKPDMYANIQLDIDLGPKLVVPRRALLFTGERRIAYVRTDETRFEPREIKTGVETGDEVEVLDGVKQGETVVTSANFLIDSESQLRASAMAMMSGGHGGHGGH